MIFGLGGGLLCVILVAVLIWGYVKGAGMLQGERAKRFFGITVLGDFVLSEGIDQVLDNLTEVAGATAVATNPTVTMEAPEGQGSFQPPSDAGSSPRLFDRPLFGKRGLWVQGAPVIIRMRHCMGIRRIAPGRQMN